MNTPQHFAISAFSLLVAAAGCFAAAAAQGAPPAQDIVVAILPFDNHSDDPRFDAFGKGLVDIMTTELEPVEGMEVVERSRVQDVLDELAFQQGAFIDPQTAQSLGGGLGATHVLTGALTALPPTLRIDLKLVEVSTARVILAEKVTGGEGDAMELPATLARRFAVALDRTLAPASLGTLDLDSLVRYGQALDEVDRGDLASASKTLSSIVQGNPTFGLAKTRYKEVMKALYSARKKREAGMTAAQQALLEKADSVLAGKSIEVLAREQLVANRKKPSTSIGAFGLLDAALGGGAGIERAGRKAGAKIGQWQAMNKQRLDEVKRHFAYRDLRGQLFLAGIQEIVAGGATAPQQAPGGKNPVHTVPSESRERVTEFAWQYVANSEMLAHELRVVQNEALRIGGDSGIAWGSLVFVNSTLDAGDIEAANRVFARMGIIFNLPSMGPPSPNDLQRNLASFLCLGTLTDLSTEASFRTLGQASAMSGMSSPSRSYSPGFSYRARPRFDPPPIGLDPDLRSTLSEALEQAAESAKQSAQTMVGNLFFTPENLKHLPANVRNQQEVQARGAVEMATIRTLDLDAECKLADGKPMEAIAVWQGILDTYPTQQDYSLYEAKIVEVLGE